MLYEATYIRISVVRKKIEADTKEEASLVAELFRPHIDGDEYSTKEEALQVQARENGAHVGAGEVMSPARFVNLACASKHDAPTRFSNSQITITYTPGPKPGLLSFVVGFQDYSREGRHHLIPLVGHEPFLELLIESLGEEVRAEDIVGSIY